MATLEEKLGASAADDDHGFTHGEAVFVDGEMLGPESGDPGQSKPDPDFITSNELLKEEGDCAEGKNESGEGGHNNLKSTFIISGVVVAIVGAIFAIAKKIKEA